MIGVDEAGRGAWAGPFLAVAVRLSTNFNLDNLNDSKKLTPVLRQQLVFKLKDLNIRIGWGWVEPSLIDKKGLTWTQVEAMRTAVFNLKPNDGEKIIVDGSINYLKDHYSNSQAVVKADAKYQVVMTASILAKVIRDDFMIKLDRYYLGYDFAQHKGYGTALHRQRLKQFKPLNKVHRFSYQPIKEFTKF